MKIDCLVCMKFRNQSCAAVIEPLISRSFVVVVLVFAGIVMMAHTVTISTTDRSVRMRA